MRGRKRKPVTLTRRDKWTLGGVAAVVLIAVASGMWLHLHQQTDRSSADIQIQARGPVRLPVADLSPGEAHTYAVTGLDGRVFRLFASARQGGTYDVAHAACRRCQSRGGSTYVRRGQLFCNHCQQPMPSVQRETDLPQQPDCTPVPIQYTLAGNDIVITRADLERTAQLLQP